MTRADQAALVRQGISGIYTDLGGARPPGIRRTAMETLNFAIPTLFGLEALAADELRRLGLDQVRAENGRVLCSGRPATSRGWI